MSSSQLFGSGLLLEPSLGEHPGPSLLLQAPGSWSQVGNSPLLWVGPDLQGEPGVHVVPIRSENRNIWGRREWLTGSVQQEESLTVHSGQRDPLYCVLKWEQMHIKSSSEQQEVGTRAVLYGLSLFLPMGMPPKESERRDFLTQQKRGRMLWKNTF